VKRLLILTAILEGAASVMFIGFRPIGNWFDLSGGLISAVGLAVTITQLFNKYRSAPADQITPQRDQSS